MLQGTSSCSGILRPNASSKKIDTISGFMHFLKGKICVNSNKTLSNLFCAVYRTIVHEAGALSPFLFYISSGIHFPFIFTLLIRSSFPCYVFLYLFLFLFAIYNVFPFLSHVRQGYHCV